MKIRYTGRHTAGVDVDVVGVHVALGETVDLPTDIAKSLLTQTGEWTRPTKEKK